MKLPKDTDKYECRIIELVVVARGEAIFDESATRVAIDDEAGGEFVTVKQFGRTAEQAAIAIDVDEWPIVRDAIDYMVSQCRPEPK